MWKNWLLLSVTLLGLILGAKSQALPSISQGCEDINPSVPETKVKCDCAIPFLAVMRTGKTGVVCANVDCEEPVQLTVTFDHESTSTPVFNDQIASNNAFSDCRKFDVPLVNTTQMAYISIAIIGETVDRKYRKEVVIDLMPEACPVQMEKISYTPGDTAKFRMICINSELYPIEKKCTKIYFVEPNGIRVAQILNPVTERNMISGEFQISKEAINGYYRLEFQMANGETIYKGFTVERRILPRFSSQVSCPSAISVVDNSANIEISARYIIDKPVNGSVIMKCCRSLAYAAPRQLNCMRGLEDICMEFTRELNSGAHTENMNLDAFKLQFSEYSNSIQCTITVNEAGTGILDTKHCYIYITKQPVSLQAESYYPHFKTGLEYPLVARLTNVKGEPMPGEIILIEVDGMLLKKAITDAEGRIQCGIDTTTYHEPNITIRASYQNEDQCYSTDQRTPWVFNRFAPNYYYTPDYPIAEWFANRYFSESGCFLQIRRELQGPLACSQSYEIKVEYKFTEAGVGSDKHLNTVFYMFKSRQNILFNGNHTVDLSGDLKGSFSINLLIDHKFGTTAQVLVYTLVKNEMIADTWELSIKGCFKNEVTLKFKQDVVEPGSEVMQELEGAPDSLCAIRAWDASLNLLNSYAYDDFSRESIFNQVSYYQYGYKVKDYDLSDPAPPCEDPNTEVFCNRRYYRPTSSPYDGDAYEEFQSFSIIVVTDARQHKPQVCGMENADSPILYRLASKFDSSGARLAESVTPIEKVRRNLQETFAYQIVILGPDGTGTATSTIPDTITEWDSKMFCLSEIEGLGLTEETAKVKTLLLFFVETTAPKYCTRGDTAIIVITVVNYMEKCMNTTVHIEPSNDYQLKLINNGDKNCICNGERTSTQYSMQFLNFGDIRFTVSASTEHISDLCNGPNDDSEPRRTDTVIVGIAVAAEGKKKEVVSSHLNIVNDSDVVNEVPIAMPDNVVDGTFQVELRVGGNPVGAAFENIGNLLTQPPVTCEWNMAQMLPIEYLLEYMESVGTVNDELYEKAKSHLCAGYARHVACRTWDGQFSLFRESYAPSSCLLVETLEAFERAEKYCYIDGSILEIGLQQLGKLQNLTTGCFNPVGPSLTDDTNTELRFTARVVTYLQNSKRSYGIGEPMLNGAQKCLQSVNPGSLDTFTLIQVFVALAEQDYYYSYATEVKSRATESVGGTHWQYENRPLVNPGCWPAEVEMASNVMLAMMWGPEDDNDYLSSIALWVAGCMNSKGSFPSAQATIMGTRAMALYGKIVYVKETNCEVSATQGDAELAHMTVNEQNMQIFQRQTLPVMPGAVKITTSGKCAIMTQMGIKYNIPIKRDDSSFSLTVTAEGDSCSEGLPSVITLGICTKYTGNKSKVTFPLITITPLPGFTCALGPLYDLINNGQARSITPTPESVFVVLDELQFDEELCIRVLLDRDSRVLAFQDSTVSAMDFYNPDESAIDTYSNPCSSILEE